MPYIPFSGVIVETLQDDAQLKKVYEQEIIAYSNKVPFLSLIGMRSTPFSSVDTVYYEDEPWSRQFELASIALVGDTTLNLVSTFGIKRHDILIIADNIYENAECVRVMDDPVGNAITVTRGFGSTTPAQIEAGDPITILTSANVEGEDDLADFKRKMNEKSTQFQYIKADYSISRQALNNAITYENRIGLMEGRKFEAQYRCWRDLQDALLAGRDGGFGIGNASNPKTITGIFNRITTNNDSNNTIDIDILNAWLMKIYNSGHDIAEKIGNINVFSTNYANIANNPQGWVLVVGWGAYAELNKLDVNYFTKSPMDNYVGAMPITNISTLFGKIPVYPMSVLPNNKMLFVRTDYLVLAPNGDMSVKHSEKPVRSDKAEDYYSGEYGFQLYHESAHGIFTITSI